MKPIYPILAGAMLLSMYGCDRNVEKSDVPFERQEEYETPAETRSNDEMDIDRDTFGDDKIDLND